MNAMSPTMLAIVPLAPLAGAIIAGLATVTVLAGVGIYEARQASQLRDRVQALDRGQEPLVAHIQHLQRERDEATNQVALASGTTPEVHRLRCERGLLRPAPHAPGQTPA